VIAGTPQSAKQTLVRSQADDVFTSEGASVSPQPSSSTQSEGSQKPLFSCGCGKCTFDSFLESGCPNPIPSASSFPYLDLSGLTHEQQQTLSGRLRFESRAIMLKFQHVGSVALKSLMKRGVTVDELLSHLTILETFDPVKKEPISTNCYADVINAQTILQLFMALRNYLSFFNYDILDQIITELGTDKDKRELRKYKDDFQVYVKRRMYKCLPQSGPMSKRDHGNILVLVDCNVFVLMDDYYESYTVKELWCFRERLREIFHTSSQGILRLKRGCYVC